MSTTDSELCDETFSNRQGPPFLLLEQMSENIKINLNTLREICQKTNGDAQDKQDLANAIHFAEGYLSDHSDDPDGVRKLLYDSDPSDIHDRGFDQLRYLFAQMAIEIAQVWELQLIDQPDDTPSNPLADIMEYAKVDP